MNARHGKIAAGVVGLVLSVPYIWAASTLPIGTTARPGAAIFPLACGVLLAIASATLVVQQCRARNAQGSTETVQLPRGAELRRVLVFAALLLLYVPLLTSVGYLGATFVLVVVLLRALKLGSRVWWRVISMSAVITVVTWFLFAELLNVQLPSGLWR